MNCIYHSAIYVFFFVYVVQVVGFDCDFVLLILADLKGFITLLFIVAVRGLIILLSSSISLYDF